MRLPAAMLIAAVAFGAASEETYEPKPGALAGRRKAQKSEDEAAQHFEQQAAAAEQQAEATAASAENDSLKKALAVCLEAKGYKVG